MMEGFIVTLICMCNAHIQINLHIAVAYFRKQVEFIQVDQEIKFMCAE